MDKVNSNISGVVGPNVPRCCGHRRSSSLPVCPPAVAKQLCNGKKNSNPYNSEEHAGENSIDLNGLVDTLNQISESLCRPAKILVEILDRKNGNVELRNNERIIDEARENLYFEQRIGTALKQLNTVEGNMKHVLPHMETILKDYKTIKERTQSRDEMLKTLDKALRRSEARGRALHGELQDMRDENKCLKEKAQQNESILRFLDTDGDTGEHKRTQQVVKRSMRNKRNGTMSGRSQSMGGLELGQGKSSGKTIDGGNKDLGAKLGHYQKLLCDHETQLQEVVALNKELVLKINERETEVMNLNCELLKYQESLAVYEEGFKNLSKDNSQLDKAFRDERKRAAELSEKLDDTEGYISCITDKVASYEVELKYLRQELRKCDKNIT